MTNHWIDIANSDAILIIGSNVAETHPIACKWIGKAQERGAPVIHVDPRFTRTSAKADIHCALRPGTDIAFIGGLIRYAIEQNLVNREYVAAYTNAPYLVHPKFEFQDGLFSGFSQAIGRYDQATWTFQVGPDGQPLRDPTLEHPQSVFQHLKRHYARYTPEMVAAVTGIPKDTFLKAAKAFCATGAPGKAGTILYAMGTTHHTVGSQNVRCHAVLQLLLGNIGLAGGGINALRGHANVQGSTDFGLLYGNLPGYLALPRQQDHPTLASYLEKETPKAGFWVNKPKFFISLLKAWWGDKAARENDFCYDYLPKVSGDCSYLAMFEAMLAGKLRGLIVIGQNPAVSGANVGMERKALGQLDWLVVRDLFPTETASFWNAPGVDPAAIKTEVFLLPASTYLEKEGSVTNSGRWIQWRYRVTEPLGAARSDGWFINNLVLRLKRLYVGSLQPKDRPILDLHWGYGEDRPDVDRIAREVNGYYWVDRKQVRNFTALKDDGSTACGNWIMSGFYFEENRAKSRKAEPEGIGANLGWAYAWPLNRRILYNRASARPNGEPWDADRVVLRWDPVATQWVGNDIPDFRGDLAPTAPGGSNPFIMRADGKGGLFSPLVEGPFPEHYEPFESPVSNLLSKVQRNPLVRINPADWNKLGDAKQFPIVATTYRLAEHHHATTRYLTWLVEMMPNMFVEMGRELAEEKGIKNGDVCTVVSARGQIRAVACVTERLKPFAINGRKIHQIGLPWHWGFVGISRGDSANILTPHVGDANTQIPEFKAFLCDIRRGG